MNIAVIGGGCAGLSSAATLAERGIAVTLFEASSQLGGRARAVAVQTQDQVHLLDNGQHILLGAYQETLSLLKKAGIDESQAFIRLPLQIHMQSALAKTVFKLKSFNLLPAPFNMLLGFLLCNGINLSERMATLKLMWALRRTNYQVSSDKPLQAFLTQHHQSVRLIALLWEPLCLAALNTPIAKASTRVFLSVLRDTFSGAKSNSDFLLPKQDLSQTLAHPLAHYIKKNGGVIRLNQRVKEIEAAEDGFYITTKQEKSLFSHVIVAVSPARVGKLLEHFSPLEMTLKQIRNYSFQPIYTIYLQYPAETNLMQMMVGLSGTLAQWLFDRGLICHQKGLLAVIVSAEGSHQALPQDELATKIAQELSLAFPHLPPPLWHKVIAEKRATFSCTPSLTRPGNKTAINNLYLAGDYTYADYPATIEGAVRSGVHCANLI